MTNALSTTLSRRACLQLACGVGLAGIATRIPYIAAAADGPSIGGDKQSFDAALGEGTDLGNSMYTYAAAGSDSPSYHVLFNQNGYAQAIDADFTAIGVGGVEEDAADVGNSRFVPTDATAATTYVLSSLTVGGTWYMTTPWFSDSVGRILIVDERDILGGYESLTPAFTHGKIALNSEDPFGTAATGGGPFVGAPSAEWEAVYGPRVAGQSFYIIEADGLGSIGLAVNPDDAIMGIDLQPDAPMSPEEACAFIGDHVNPSAVVGSHHYLPITPSRPVELHVHTWDTGDGEAVIHSGFRLEDGVVTRIMISSWEYDR